MTDSHEPVEFDELADVLGIVRARVVVAAQEAATQDGKAAIIAREEDGRVWLTRQGEQAVRHALLVRPEDVAP